MYRATARWVVTSFGALAAALVAGVPLTSLGTTHGWRLIVAILAVSVIFGAILQILRVTVPVMRPSRGNYEEFGTPRFDLLHGDLKRHPEPLRKKAKDEVELVGLYDKAVDTMTSAWEQHTEHPGNETLEDAFQVAKQKYEELDGIVISVTWLGLWLNARQRFEQAMKKTYFAVGLAIASSVAFAYFANPPAKAEKPERVIVHVAAQPPGNCASLYLTLAELARRAPAIATHWPAKSLGAQAHACGLPDRSRLTTFLHFLSHAQAHSHGG